MVMSSTSNAFMLRPVSRNSTSAALAGKTQNEDLDMKSPAAKAAIAAAVAAAKMGPKDLSMNSLGPELRSACASNGTIHSRVMIRRQRTTESAPTSHQLLMSSGGNTLKQFPRQQSNASAYSMAIPSTYSHQGITLVRGASCSLVDIPTYLGPANVGFAGKAAVTGPISAATGGNICF